MKVIFFGSSDYCLPILESLHKNFDLVAVITRPNSPIEKFATSQSVHAFTPKDKMELLSLKNDLEKLHSDLAIVADYGLIIPKEIFTIPRHQTLNIHFSKLPKYRGPSPVQYTILNGEKSAWISVIIMDETMDTGDIIFRQEVGPLDGDETTSLLYRKLFSIAAQELPDIIDKYLHKQLKPLKQPDSGVSYTKSFTRADGYIPFSQLVSREAGSRSAGKLERKIRALSPWPGVWTIIKIKNQERRLKILRAHLEPSDSAQGKPTTYNLQPTTKLIPDLVQLEGKKPVTWKQFKEGYPNSSL